MAIIIRTTEFSSGIGSKAIKLEDRKQSRKQIRSSLDKRKQKTTKKQVKVSKQKVKAKVSKTQGVKYKTSTTKLKKSSKVLQDILPSLDADTPVTQTKQKIKQNSNTSRVQTNKLQKKRKRQDDQQLQQQFSKKQHSMLDSLYGYCFEESECSDDEFDNFIQSLPPLDSVVPRNRQQILPRKTRSIINKKTLVLDLDETLIHSSMNPWEVKNPDLEFDITFHRVYNVFVKIRPHLQDFLLKISQLFEVVVFTASVRAYGEKLLNFLDPQRVLIKHRLYRDSCLQVEQNYLKDISILGRDLRDVIIVDNNPQAFGFQIDNGIPIASWYGDEQDDALLRLLPFLEVLSNFYDVREAISYKFGLKLLCKQPQTQQEEG